MTKLLKVVLRVGSEVPFQNSVDATLTAAQAAVLELDLESRCVRAKCNRPDRDPICIPLESVRYWVEFDSAKAHVEATEKAEAERKAKKAAAEEAAKKPPATDTVRLVKGPGGALGSVGPDGKFVALDVKPPVAK